MIERDRKPLSDAAVGEAIPRAKVWRMYDSKGLILEIHPNGGKYWRLKYRFAGREKRLSLGVFPDVKVSEARERRDEARELLVEGIDPSELRKAERVTQLEHRARQDAAIRFMIDNDGVLSLRLGARQLSLTAAETAELRAFLDATRAITPRA
ncbi:Arm DNA-binding domain-containing protein [Burkholderia vietnamiensis]|uniref:Arm DNA-binding domain-containing protein n=1 Tax=Burkholderia vietnamiensis TaxID=60552 RepID=UPI001CF584ED|nr:Arm DNA-binding domain-containing protein [Burkholderia vietnamiensis]MCA8199201.1 Arm DNA-binding domain-containing protein [Burkholderia vietnamiensis]